MAQETEAMLQRPPETEAMRAFLPFVRPAFRSIRDPRGKRTLMRIFPLPILKWYQ